MGQMLAPFHHRQNLREVSEVGLLGCLERVVLEELDDLLQVFELPDSQFHPRVVVHDHGSCSEELLQSVQGGSVAFVLNNPEFWQDLPAG